MWLRFPSAGTRLLVVNWRISARCVPLRTWAVALMGHIASEAEVESGRIFAQRLARSPYLKSWDASWPDSGRGIAELRSARKYGGLNQRYFDGTSAPIEHRVSAMGCPASRVLCKCSRQLTPLLLTISPTATDFKMVGSTTKASRYGGC